MSRLTNSLSEILTYFGRGAMSAQGTFWQQLPQLRRPSVCTASASSKSTKRGIDFRSGYRILM